ncbi:signal peptidase I [Vitreimonas sp.]|jgi:signal peptidase I|uniref:signal peptidase I n=1 Tax=Vitreimonas sp. TaxID=3069702 RepID=UPI002ED7B8AB
MTDQDQSLRTQVIDWAKTIAGAFVAYTAFTTVAFANYRIPSESMVPHLEVGDRVAVSKYAYGYSRYSLPFNAASFLPASAHRLLQHMPRRGDVVVFIHPVSGETMIKRAIGLPGDVIEVRRGDLIINGAAVETSPRQRVTRAAFERGAETAQRYDEILPDGFRHATHTLSNDAPLDNFGPYIVPEDHIFFMGDNRDNSLDSRWDGMGAVPLENLIGRAEIVYATPPGRDAEIPRFLRPLHY